eukprot:220358_1
MLSLLQIFCILQVAQSLTLPSPRSLQVNYIHTHEECKLTDRKHLPMVEIVNGNGKFNPPIFSWKLDSFHQIYNDSQIFYHIEIYHEHNILSSQKQLVYASEAIKSTHPFCNTFYMSELENILISLKWQILSFRVKWSNTLLEESGWSQYGRFILTSGSINDWNNASYIAKKTNSEFNQRVPLFRNQFSITPQKTIKSAVLITAGLGFFRVWVNDKDVLAMSNPPIAQIPGWTNTNKRVPYVTFDVSSYINTNSMNEIIFALGIGYRNTTAFPPLNGRSKYDIIDCVVKSQLIITYNDNSQQIIVSDNSWQTALSAIVISSIYNGEIYNENFNEKDKIVWQNVTVLASNAGPPGVLYNSVQPYVSITGSNKAVHIYPNAQNTSQIIDFGSNSAGLTRINVAGLKSDTIIRMKHAEVKLHPNYGPANGNLYYANLRTAQQEDQFIASGITENATKPVWWTPLFTIHGFQYVELWGYPRNITINDIFKLEIHADLKNRSTWSSSDKVLNDINSRCINGQLSNLQSVVTDCDQRDERLGWMGDAGLTSNTMSINFDMASFYSNWILLMNDSIGADGSIPDVVPQYRYGGRPSDPNWGMAFPQITNVLNLYYNMTDTVKQFMASMSLPKYVENLKSRMPQLHGKDNIAMYPDSYSDWVPPPPNPSVNKSFAGAYGYIKTVQIVSSLCDVTGNVSYKNYLNSLNQQLITEFIAAFWNSSQNQYLDGLQTSYVMALEANIYSNNAMKTQLQNGLIERINKNSNLLTTGIIGTKFILPILASLNNQSLAMEIIKGGDNASYPSWSYEADNIYEPASAVWELWDGDSGSPGMDSRNHHAFTTISQYFNEHISGLIQLKYNKWRISIGHLNYNQLKWSKIMVNEAMVSYHWNWNSYLSLNINIVIPVGHKAIIQFSDLLLNNYYDSKYALCNWMLKDINDMWNMHSLMNQKQYWMQYNAEIDHKGNVVIGSGIYAWTIFCVKDVEPNF